MSDFWAVGANRTLYEVRGTRLFIDDEEATPVDGRPWRSASEAKNAADSHEIADTHGFSRIKRSDWNRRKAKP